MSKTMFSEAKNPELAEMVDFTNSQTAKESVGKLKKEFEKTDSRERKLQVARAVQLAENRAGAIINKKSLSDVEKKQFKDIQSIYGNLADKLWDKYKNKTEKVS